MTETTHVSAFPLESTAVKMREAYKEYLKKNKWIPYGSWLGRQLDAVFNS